MQIGTVSGLWLCGRSWRFKIPFWRNIVRFWKSYVCSNKLDVQETNCCFSQFNRIWNHLSGHRSEIGWFARSGIMGSNCFCLWKYFSYFRSNRAGRLVDTERRQKSRGKINVLKNIDYVHSNVKSSRQEALLCVFEDNEAVIKMIMKGRSPTMRHASRTHTVDLDWLFNRINWDLNIQIKYSDTKDQLAVLLTKGTFTRDEWNHILCLFNISHFSSTNCLEVMSKRTPDASEEKSHS